MKKYLCLGSVGVGLMLLLMNCAMQAPVVEKQMEVTHRELKFSGFDWIVRNDVSKKGPGPNFFSNSEENVWIDKDGKLHLKITQKDGNWYCAGMYCKQPLGYGKYTFYVHSDITLLDQNVVSGLFTYLNDVEEIDIEFSKWSIPDNQNAQFAIQPADKTGNKHRFQIPSNAGPTKHSFDWKKDKINFISQVNSDAAIAPFAVWKYTGPHIPKATTERMRINLWLFKGQMPSDLKEQEIIIDSVSFQKH